MRRYPWLALVVIVGLSGCATFLLSCAGAVLFTGLSAAAKLGVTRLGAEMQTASNRLAAIEAVRMEFLFRIAN